MRINILRDDDNQTLAAGSGKSIEKVDDFLYLGSRMKSSEKDFEVRKAKAWGACHQMKLVWKSDMRRELKVRLFLATVESILLYGSETWTASQTLAKRIDGCYTRMLRMALNIIDWKERQTNAKVYGHLIRASDKIAERRMRLAGHLARHEDLRFWTRGFPLEMRSRKPGLPFAIRAQKWELCLHRYVSSDSDRKFLSPNFINIS